MAIAVIADHLSIIMPNDLFRQTAVRIWPGPSATKSSHCGSPYKPPLSLNKQAIDHAAQSATTPFEQFGITIAETIVEICGSVNKC